MLQVEEKQSQNNKWVSWNGNIQHAYNEIYRVTSEEELVKVIIDAKKVRVFGSKQSSADISAGAETLVDITRFNQVISIDQEKKQITVEPGIILSDLLEVVHEKGWCISCLPDINTITISGAISTGTHGTGKEGKILSEYMVACRLITASGEVLEIDDQHEYIHAVRVSLGVLGVFSEITLQCQDDYTLELEEGPMLDEKWMTELPALLEKNDFLRILFLPHANNSYVIQGNKIDPQKEVKVTTQRPFLSKRRAWSKFLYSYTHKYPKFTVFANKLLYKLFFTDKKTAKGNLYDATVTKSRGSTLELAEWTIPLSKFQKLFTELREILNDPSSKTFIHIPMDVRFIKADQTWLSYAYNEDIVTVGCVCRNTSQADSYYAFQSVEKLFLKYGGRPHWAKRFGAKGDTLSELYPKWGDFLKLREELDPSKKFLNAYLEEIFI